jgi:hypothetical protein
MDFTTDKLRSMVRKWQTLIEAHVDIKTTDGYGLRLFCIGFTKKRQGQVKKTCYAQSSQIRNIRRKMVEIMQRESTSVDLKDLVGKFIPEAIGTNPGCCTPPAASFLLVHFYVLGGGVGRGGFGRVGQVQVNRKNQPVHGFVLQKGEGKEPGCLLAWLPAFMVSRAKGRA